MKVILIKLFHFDIIQHKWGRKWIGGKYYHIETALSMFHFWSDEVITNCQARILKEEEYG